MNRVNSRSGSALLRRQQHKHCRGCYYYYYYTTVSSGVTCRLVLWSSRACSWAVVIWESERAELTRLDLIAASKWDSSSNLSRLHDKTHMDTSHDTDTMVTVYPLTWRHAAEQPVLLYGSECWAVTKRDVHKTDALGQWCLRKLPGIERYHYVRNDDVRRTTEQPHLSSTVQARRLSLFAHISRMPDESDAKQILSAPPPGGDHQDVPVVRGWSL